MPTIEIIWDAKSKSFIHGKKMERAFYSASKKAGADALRAMRAEAKRAIRARVRIRAAHLSNRALPLRFPQGTTLLWKMLVSGQPIPLGEYPRRQTRAGVSVEVKAGQRVMIKSAFLAKSRTGRQGVFLRPGKARHPMGHRLGLSAADTMKDGQIPQGALQRAAVVMESAFARLMAMEMKKAP